MIIRDIINLFRKFSITVEEVEKTIEYLRYFNYLVENWNIDDFIKALMDLQRDANLKVDGELGPKTLKAMSEPRCGCVDKNHMSARGSTGKWGVDVIRFYIKSHDKDLSKAEWTKEIAAGFSSWSQHIPVDVEEVDSANHANLIVDVGWGRRDNFDGPGGTLAWAYLVPSNNFKGQISMKFDLEETWITMADKGRGIRLRNVAAHEFGHTLGFEHSNVKGALMAPFYNYNIYEPQQNDDITRAQAVYGKRTTPAPKPEPEPKPDTPGGDTPVDKDTLTIIVRGDIESINIPGYRIYKP